ncbi:MAG TPA: GtrA family protein [Eubacterium sp.]|nr:GtrA family protein [Eubacterium sp.]
MLKKYWDKYREIIVYLIVGVMTTIVSLGTYYLCVCTVLDPKDPLKLQLANIISWCAAVMFAYFANRRFVFRSHNENKLKECTQFVSSRVATLIVDMVMMFVLVSVLDMNDKIAKLLVQVVITVLNYVLSKFLVFRKKSSAAVIK